MADFVTSNKELSGSSVASNKEFSGSSVTSNKELAGSSITSNKKLTGSSVTSNKELAESSVTRKEPTGSSVINKKPTGSSVINKEPTRSSVINKEPTGSSVINKEPIGSSVINKEPTGSSVINKEPTGSSVISKEPTGSSVINKEPTGSSVSSKEQTGISVINKEPTGSSVINKEPTGSGSFVNIREDLDRSFFKADEESALRLSGASKKFATSAKAEWDADSTDSSSSSDSCTTADSTEAGAIADVDCTSDSADVVEPLMEKHLLNSCWTLWFYKCDRSRAWLDSQLSVANFSSVEDFWRLIQFAMPPSRLPPGCDYSVFRAGCPPMWEAPVNRNGGRWMLSLDRRSTDSAVVDNAWTEVLLMAIGEAYPDRVGRQLCGLVVQIRSRHYRLCLWTRSANDPSACYAIGHLFRSALQRAFLVEKQLPTLIYEAHATYTTTASNKSSMMSSRRTAPAVPAAFASCGGTKRGKSKPMYTL